jgi:hypothetical protein
MTKHKASWKLYSSRRKITLESLVTQGKVVDYVSYTDYCNGFHVEPLSEPEFIRQSSSFIAQLRSPTPVASSINHVLHTDEPKVTEVATEVATETASEPESLHSSDADLPVPSLSKKKKQRDASSESGM